MDYQTPLRIVNIAKDLLLTVPDNDQLRICPCFV